MISRVMLPCLFISARAQSRLHIRDVRRYNPWSFDLSRLQFRLVFVDFFKALCLIRDTLRGRCALLSR
jgi:hypothetical protein